MTTICLLNGHPHDDPAHFCMALADAYAEGAAAGGHEVLRLDLARLDVPILRDPADFGRPPPPALAEARQAISASAHLVTIYPLWLGTMPALVKAFFEQIARDGFAISASDKGWPRKMLAGRSARVVVTMGMPAAAYRVIFGAHGVRGFESGILGMSGFRPIRETLIGGVGAMSDKAAARRLAQMRSLGEKAR